MKRITMFVLVIELLVSVSGAAVGQMQNEGADLQPGGQKIMMWSVPYSDGSHTWDHAVRAGDCSATLSVTTLYVSGKLEVETRVPPVPLRRR